MDVQWIGRPKQLASWQMDFHADWINMSNCNEHHLAEKQLKWLKAPKNTKGCAEHLAQLEVEEHQPSGKYLMEIDCCPAYLISWFLLCKHLVHKANQLLDNTPLDDLSFFFKLCQQCYPPYYMINGIHKDRIPDGPDGDDSDDANLANIHILGCDIQMG